MKKRAVFIALLMTFGSAKAQIPVTDVIHITTSVTNQIETIAQWAKQYEQMVTEIEKMNEQIKQMENHYKAITGSRGMGQIQKDSTMLTTDWVKMLANVKGSATYSTVRKQYPTLEGRPKANEMYDVMASHDAITYDLFVDSNKHITEIQNLMKKIDGADDPAAKADLLNRLIVQQNALKANQNMVALMNQKQAFELQTASRKASEENVCKEFTLKKC